MSTVTAVRPRDEVRRSSVAERTPALDRARGLAVVLMVLDHLAAFGLAHYPDGEIAGVDPREVVRHTITRAALPLFMLVCGYLLAWRGLRSSRLLTIAALGCAASMAVETVWIGLGGPEILLVLALVLCFWRAIVRWPIGAVVVGVVQVATLPMFGRWGWYGYEPGEVAALLACGVLWRRHYCGSMLQAGAKLPRWFGWVGRFPLWFYGAHLAGLLALGLAVR